MKFVDCKYWEDGNCLLNRYDRPTPEQCLECIVRGHNKKTGLGDTVAVAINKTPLRRLKRKGCGCKKRQDQLNKAVKYGTPDKPEN